MRIARFSPRNLGRIRPCGATHLWLQDALAECGGRIEGLTLARSVVVLRKLVTLFKVKLTSSPVVIVDHSYVSSSIKS